MLGKKLQHAYCLREREGASQIWVVRWKLINDDSLSLSLGPLGQQVRKSHPVRPKFGFYIGS